MEYPLLHEQRDWEHYTTRRLGLSRLWNSGNSFLGLLCAVGGSGTWHKTDRMLEVSGGWLIALLSRAGWASAITLGEVVLYADSRLIPLLHDHERVHVHQGRVWGPFFLPAYVLESAYQWLRTGRGYWNNRFEVAAYSAASIGDKSR